MTADSSPPPARGYRVGVIGATGAVGSTVLKVLDERQFPVSELVPFASPRSAGKVVEFGGRDHSCEVLDSSSIQGFDLVISSAGGSVSADWVPKFVDAGAVVIDKSSSWRMKEDIPLVVSEVNPDALERLWRGEHHQGIVASPNCSTMQMVVALKPILDAVGIEEIVVATYQSVSGTGERAVQELRDQSSALLRNESPAPSVYPHQIAFNVIPQVETFDDSTGYTTEELKMMRETRKIFGLSEEELPISATCVRVPVYNAHSEAIRVKTRKELSPERCRELLDAAPGVTVVDDPSRLEYPLAVDAVGQDDVFVGRIRKDLGGERCLSMWVVGDNLRKGAATNAVQIAELLVERGLLRAERDLRSPAAV